MMILISSVFTASHASANDSETGRTYINNVMTCGPYGVAWSQSNSDGCLSDNSVGMPTRIYCDAGDQPVSVAAFVFGGHSRGPVRVSVGNVKFTLKEKGTSRIIFEGDAPIRLGLDDTKTAGGLSMSTSLPVLPVGSYNIQVDYSGGRQVHVHTLAPGEKGQEPHGVLITWPKATRTFPLEIADCSSNFTLKKASGSLPANRVSTSQCTRFVNYVWQAFASKADGNRELGVFKGCIARIPSRIDGIYVRKISLTRQVFPKTRWVVSRSVTPPRIDYGELPMVAAWKVDKEPIWIREWSARTRSLVFGDVWPLTTPYIYPDADLDRMMNWISWFSCHTEPPQAYADIGKSKWLRNYEKWCQDYSFVGSSDDRLRGVVTNRFAQAPPPSRDLIQVVTAQESPAGSCIASASLWRKLHEDFQKTIQLRNNVKTTADDISFLEWRQMILDGALAASVTVTAFAIYASLAELAAVGRLIFPNVIRGVSSLQSAPVVERLLLQLATVERNSILRKIGLIVVEGGLTAESVKKQAAIIAWLAQSTQFVVKWFSGSYEKELDEYQLGWYLDLASVVTGGGLVRLTESKSLQVLNAVTQSGSGLYGFVSDLKMLADQSNFIGEHDLQLSEFLTKSRLYQKQLAKTYVTAGQLKDAIDNCNQDLDESLSKP